MKRIRDEVIEGVYFMTPSPDFSHTIVVENIGVIIKNELDKQKSECRVSMENLDLHYHPDIDDDKKKGDYITPDVMIVSDTSLIKKGGYYGVPKFVVEVLSPSTMRRDRTEKFRIYETLGVSEYWIINPKGVLEIYYLEDGHYQLHDGYMLCDEDGDEDNNENTVLTLREFPDITMTLGSIFA